MGFLRTLGTRTLSFGVSGWLYPLNGDPGPFELVMYDDQTESLWLYLDGKAIAGELSGRRLSLISMPNIRFSQFKARYPDGLVWTY